MKAVIFVDIQNDIVNDILNNKSIDIVPKIVEFAKYCVKNDYKLYTTRNTNTEYCIEGTNGWMVDKRLMEVLDGKCTFINKTTFGSFDLVDIIEEDFSNTYQYIENYHCKIQCCAKEKEPLDEIIVCGFYTNVDVLSNCILLRTKFPNIKITVMKDLCIGTTDENHELMLIIMKSCQIDN